jgi:hypothetical protein
MKKIKITVSYPWATIPSDCSTIIIDEGTTNSDIANIAYDYALDMIFNRGIEYDYEVVNEDAE